MGPEAYKPGVPTALKKCSERVTNSCNPAETDSCCGGPIPCIYCLEWHPYGHAIQYGTATFSGSTWSGTIAGATWIGYWQRNYYSGECEFVVTLDGHEIYRKSCYAGQKCRDSSDSASATIGYDSGTIFWKKYESRPLEYVIDPNTHCRKYFCGNCDCSCTCLCVTITELNGYIFKGEICDVSYPCDGPLWVGTVGPYSLSIALGRDIYDRCIITATVDGHEQAPVLVSGCASMSATITLYDGTTIAIRCKKCDCEDKTPYPCECRLDAVRTIIAKVTISSGSPCEVACPGGATTTVPSTNQAWLFGDCVHSIGYGTLISAFPPNCTESDPDKLSYRVVFVQKMTDGPTPFINNAIVQKYEWYGVVYKIMSDTILGVFYEYDSCCINNTPNNPATSHFAWVVIRSVSLGPSVYDCWIYNDTTAAEHGNCGIAKPIC